MRELILAALSAAALSTPALADVTLDFEDLVGGTEYATGASFVTGGITVNTEAFQSGSGAVTGSARVQSNTLNAEGSGNEILTIRTNLNIEFNPPVPSLTLKFAQIDLFDVNLELNNGGYKLGDNFNQLEGQSYPSITSVVANYNGTVGDSSGTITISGTISQFGIGGFDSFWIDDLTYVPEPVSALGAVALLLAAARRR